MEDLHLWGKWRTEALSEWRLRKRHRAAWKALPPPVTHYTLTSLSLPQQAGCGLTPICLHPPPSTLWWGVGSGCSLRGPAWGQCLGQRALMSLCRHGPGSWALGSWHTHRLTLRVLSAPPWLPLVLLLWGAIPAGGGGLHSPLELNDGKGGLGSGDKSHAAFKANAGFDRRPKASTVPGQAWRRWVSAKQLLIVPVEPDFQNLEANVDFGGCQFCSQTQEGEL